jgi:WD40 repeat protein/formylglycine-generating enzyme required for sulfatase activity
VKRLVMMRNLVTASCLACFSMVALAEENTGPSGSTQSHAQATAAIVADLEAPESVSKRMSDMLASQEGEFSFTINFDYDKWDIRTEFDPLLESIGKALAKVPPDSVTLTFEGHTDWDGSDSYNLWLSQQRAQAVEQYLSSRFNIHFRQTDLIFWGERKPISNNTTRTGMAQNRRVEFHIRPAIEPAQIPERYAVAYSPDGRLALSSGRSNELLLRNTELDCHQRSMSGHIGEVLAADFSANGRLAVSGGRDSSVRLWDTATGRAIGVFYGHEAVVNTVVFGPRGRVAASGSEDRSLRVWDLVEDLEIATLRGHGSGVTTTDFSNNGWYLASGDRDGMLFIWEVGNSVEARRLQAAGSAITAVEFVGNDRVLVGDLGGGVRIWDRENGELILAFQKSGAAIYSADVSADGRFAVTTDAGGRMIIWVIATGRKFGELQAHDSPAVFAAFSDNGQLIMTADTELVHRIWDFKSGKMIRGFTPIKLISAADGLAREGDTPADLWLEPKSGIELVRMPADCYSIGCGPWTENCSQDELPAHEVCLNGFWMGRYEVTQSQWVAVVGANPSKHKAGGLYPVEQVSWNQAQDFICKLNSLTNLEFTLPSEAQWEYACRGGGVEAPHADGDENGLSIDEAIPYPEVNQGSPNIVGIYGMNSGIWEWVADVYEDNLNISVYSELLHDNPLHTGSNDYRFSTAEFPRINRGGTWTIGSNPTRCSLRHFDEAGMRNFFTGFRVALPDDTNPVSAAEYD